MTTIKTKLSILNLMPAIILIEGFVSVAAEIIAIRQLLPFVGGSVIVTSLIIGIFLLFLALGYRKGGQIQENLLISLQKNFFIASLFFGLGLSYLFILMFFSFMEKTFGYHLAFSLLTYLLLVLAPLIYILGQTIPIAMNLAKQNKPIGLVGGNTLGLSTIGSFLGATLTALIFMNFLGVAWTVFINFCLLLALALSLTSQLNKFIMQSCFAIFAIFAVYSVNIQTEHSIFTLTNQYANYQIVELANKFEKLSPLDTKKTNSHPIVSQGGKILAINHSRGSFLDENLKGFPYIEAIKKILFSDLRVNNEDILVLGAGGFTLSAENTFNNRFIYVDIDQKIKNVVHPKFLNHINGTLIAKDARSFVRYSEKAFAAIIVDTFSNINSIPAHLLTVEYLLDLKKHLKENGVIIFNMIARPTLSDAYSKRIDNTIRYVFKNCMAMPLSFQNAITNILYVCHQSPNQTDYAKYTDDLNTSTSDAVLGSIF